MNNPKPFLEFEFNHENDLVILNENIKFSSELGYLLDFSIRTFKNTFLRNVINGAVAKYNLANLMTDTLNSYINVYYPL